MPIVYENDGHRRRMMKLYPQFQFKVLEFRKDPHCRLCRREMHIEAREGSWKNQATVDHVMAQSLGGPDEESNWALVCSKCNNKKARLESSLKDIIDALRGQGNKRASVEKAFASS